MGSNGLARQGAEAGAEVGNTVDSNQSIDRDALSVYLSLSRDTLLKQHAMLPRDA